MARRFGVTSVTEPVAGQVRATELARVGGGQFRIEQYGAAPASGQMLKAFSPSTAKWETMPWDLCLDGFVQTSDATPTNLITYHHVPNGAQFGTIGLRSTIVAAASGGIGRVAKYVQEHVYGWDGVFLTLYNSSTIFSHEYDAGLSLAFSVSTGPATLSLAVIGLAATTIRWAGKAELIIQPAL